MFVHAHDIAEIGRRHAGVGRMRLVVRRAGDTDEMQLLAEGDAADEALRTQLADTLNAVTRLRGSVELVPPGSLPNDGKVIADEREFG
jgi:phenylacetate-CoA ligase